MHKIGIIWNILWLALYSFLFHFYINLQRFDDLDGIGGRLIDIKWILVQFINFVPFLDYALAIIYDCLMMVFLLIIFISQRMIAGIKQVSVKVK